MDSAEDRDLAQRFARGDTSALDDMVRIHGERLTRTVYRLLGWSQDVDDVVQDVFASAWANRHRFRREARLSTYLTAIAVNACRRLRRRHRLRLLSLGRLWNSQRRSEPETPEAALDRTETSARVREAVGRLPQRYREVVILRYLEALPVADVARAVGLSENAASVRLHRARAMLGQSLEGLL